MLHLKTVILSFLSASCLLYASIMFSYSDPQSSRTKVSPSSHSPSGFPKSSLRILTARPKSRPSPPPTVKPSTAKLITWEAQHISDHFGLVFWTLINGAYLDLTRNWLCQTSRMSGIHERVFVITVDEPTAVAIRSDWPLISVLSLGGSSSTLFNSSLTWGERRYTDFLLLRASILRMFVNADVRFVLFETDAVWLSNPYVYFSNYSRISDVAVPRKYRADARGRDITFDPMLVVPNPKTKRFFDEMYRRLTNPTNDHHRNGTTLHDQDILDDLCKSDYAGVRCRTFLWEHVADGRWFKLDDRQRSRLPTLIVNNNFYSGVENKITRQALNGFWFLTVGRACDSTSLNKLDVWNSNRQELMDDEW